jgi:hypothetical protein
MLNWVRWSRSRRRLVFLSPARHQCRSVWFGNVQKDESRHHKLLHAAQRLRGATYCKDGAIQSSDLTIDGRHVQTADDLSYHILTVDDKDHVLGCMRYRVHGHDVRMDDLTLNDSAVARSKTWGPLVHAAVQDQIASARLSGFSYVELGGWAMSESLRGGTDAIRMLLSVYALARATGGAVGITTATVRHHSSSILRRMGGQSLTASGRIVPPYFDSQFNCEMELLRFHSDEPNPQYAALVASYQAGLTEAPVIVRAPRIREQEPARLRFGSLPNPAPLL